MKKLILSGVITVFLLSTGIIPVHAQKVAVKTNLLYGATTTPNLGIETAIGKKSTLELLGGYNPFRFGDKEANKKLWHWLVQTEYRYWFCERFNGHIMGVHAFYSDYNISGKRLNLLFGSDSKNYRHEGNIAGVGISYGYNWMLGKHWNIEFAAGIGYGRMNYDKYECPHCGEKKDHVKENYFGPTKAGISLIYLIK